MSIARLKITKKKKPRAEGISQLQDFQYQDIGELDIDSLANNQCYSLYCLDDTKKRVIFVKTPPSIDITDSAFYYQSQYEYAEDLLAVNYEDLASLVKLQSHCFSSLILIYSTSRCGSTLLSRAFYKTENTVNLSEPDIFSSMVGLREKDGSRDQELIELIYNCTQLLFKYPHNQLEKKHLVIKFRSFNIELIDLINKAFPNANNIFLYRNAIGVIDSSLNTFFLNRKTDLLIRFLNKTQLDQWIIGLILLIYKKRLSLYISIIDRYPSSAIRSLGFMAGTLMIWLSPMEICLREKNSGLKILPIRYEDLTTEPNLIISKIFKYVGVAERPTKEVLNVFSHDSQAGSSIQKQIKPKLKSVLSAKDIQKISEFLADFSPISSIDYIIPNSTTRPKPSEGCIKNLI